MYAVTKTYKDFNGVERTETKLFNLTETEVMEMELGTAGGVAEMLQRIVDAKDQPTIIKFFKEFILSSLFLTKLQMRHGRRLLSYEYNR